MTQTLHNRCGVRQHVVRSGLGHDFELHVSLPATYDGGDQRYPVLYVLDSYLYFGVAADIARLYGMGNFATRSKPPGLKLPSELIVVGIGYPGEQPVDMTRDLLKRRMFDYTSLANPTGEGERLRSVTLMDHPNGIPYGGAAEFFSLLKDSVVPLIDRSYRTSAEKVLYGSSSGGHFAAYTLLRKDSPFSQYIIGSPAIYLCGEDLMEREAAYAAENKDLAAKVFLSFGNREWDEYAFPAVASGTTRFGEKLVLRRYPSLRLRTQIIDRANHIEGCVGSLLFGLGTLAEWGL